MTHLIKNLNNRRIIFLPLAAIVILFVYCGLNSSGYSNGDWPTGSPQSQGLDRAMLSILDSRIEAGDYGEVHSLLVIRNGCLVFERYYRGYDSERRHRLYSVTKSFTSALVGIAHEQGVIDRLDRIIFDFFPEYDFYENMSGGKADITLENILSMQMGTEWNEFNYPFDDSRNSIYRIRQSTDWVKFVLDLPMVEPPGSRFRYNTGATMVLSGVIRNRTGNQTVEFADEHLLEPLGIDDYEWESGAQNLTNTGWGLWMRPRDMARFGQMFLDGGRWDGVQVVPAGWVELSTSDHVRVNDQFHYGYQWWLMSLENTMGHSPSPDDVKICWGYGGQFIFVIPELRMVVVSTAGNYGGYSGEEAVDFVPEYVVRAVRGR